MIRNWNEDKVLKRARIQAIKKFGAEKVIWNVLFCLLFYLVMDVKLLFFMVQVIMELEPNESKVHTGNDNFYQDIGDDQYNEGMRYEKSENKDWNENVMFFNCTFGQ